MRLDFLKKKDDFVFDLLMLEASDLDIIILIRYSNANQILVIVLSLKVFLNIVDDLLIHSILTSIDLRLEVFGVSSPILQNILEVNDILLETNNHVSTLIRLNIHGRHLSVNDGE